MDPDKTLVEWAMRDLQCFGAETREEAAVALEMWSPMRKLRARSVDAAAEVTELVLARFSPAEPPHVPGLDWLPSPDEVASYTAAVAESLAVPAPVKPLIAARFPRVPGDEVHDLTEVPAPVKALPAEPRRWRDAEGQFWQERSDGLIALETERGLSGLFVCTDESQFADAYGPVFEVTP